MGFSDQVCSQLEPISLQDVDTAQNAHNDAVQQLQVATVKLSAAQTAFQQLNLQNPNLQQLNIDLVATVTALGKWQSDYDQALAAIADATGSAYACQRNSALAAAATQAQAYAGYFTDPNILLQVATLNQALKSLYQAVPLAIQQAQLELQTKIQALSNQLVNCISVRGQWWGVQLILDENCTKVFQDFMNSVAVGGVSGVPFALLSGPPPVNLLNALFWFICTAEAFLVAEDVKKIDDQMRGVTINISWIPLGAGLLANIASLGIATPEVVSIEMAAETATLLEETGGAFGNQWISFFWFTSN